MISTFTAEQTAGRIGAAQILPVLRTATAEEAHALALRLLSLGLTALELTATTPGWKDVLTALRSEAPQALIGLGTVVTGSDAEQAFEGGAQFLVSPYPAPEVRTIAVSSDRLFIEGGFTPGELAAGTARGVAKLFPAHVGGPTYLKSMLAVLPGTRIIPTGGIPISDVPLWLDAGAFAVGVGSDLYAGGDVDATVGELLAALPRTIR
ncbi:bifunctional 4-hydroxy-2-oxoglutarate aldolase/2-dehydro-3-deoxy-phosphogluconate aldolase [Pseudarthrobacter oxydans]|uniref:bifunctional 4-hydroxy-2-oxoglutarate aldolase/2-dehydro-3-deoxy-phosphogluconate aldolase n=1 Tax=Pseudarthrobacter oxydans TaxID=1671 RepID=UPI00344B0C24